MNIFVNATAADVGGLKSIVDHFLTHISKSEEENTYYIFVSNDHFNTFKSEKIIIINTNSKKWIKRLLWDSNGMKRWANKNNIIPNQIISLQNTAVNFKNVNQIIYLHTPIPFVEYEWKLTKKNQRKLWFYKNIYPFFIKLFLNNNCSIVVQANWLKKRVSSRMKVSENRIFVIKPDFSLKQEDIDMLLNVDSNRKSSDQISMFYPAIDYVYKNHLTILKALKKLKDENNSLYQKLVFVITVDEQSDTYKYAKQLGIEDAIKFLGKVPFSEIVKEYKRSNFVLFPSYIETAGLPLLEAAYFKKLIICSDEVYARELIGDYKGVHFTPSLNVDEWKRKIEHHAEANIPLYEYTINKSANSWDQLLKLVKKGD